MWSKAKKRAYAKQWRENNKDKIKNYYLRAKKLGKYKLTPEMRKKNRIKTRAWFKVPGNQQRHTFRQIEHKKKRKQEIVSLLGNKCADCKTSYPLECYDFHHKNPKQKDKNVSALLSCKWERVLKEVKKCVLICSNCHRIRHRKQEEKKCKK